MQGGADRRAPAPEIDGVDFDGNPVKLSDYRGKTVAVVFWASWCPPCCAMIPHERKIVERYRDKPFAMIGVNLDRNPGKAREIMLAQNMTWPIVKGAGCDAISQAYGISSIPAVFVIDADGILRCATSPARPWIARSRRCSRRPRPTSPMREYRSTQRKQVIPRRHLLALRARRCVVSALRALIG